MGHCTSGEVADDRDDTVTGSARTDRVLRGAVPSPGAPSPAAASSASSGLSRRPVGTVHIKDPSPLNWLFITWNTVEEPVRTDAEGHIVPAVLTDFRWLEGGRTLEIDVRQGIQFQDGEPLTAHHVKRAFDEVQRWQVPHPPGTYLNFDPAAAAQVVDEYLLRIHFPRPDGLAMAKFRGLHVMSSAFWDRLGFGYDRTSSGEGHW
jgi:ABC-type transport system substrate-binding protein